MSIFFKVHQHSVYETFLRLDKINCIETKIIDPQIEGGTYAKITVYIGDQLDEWVFDYKSKDGFEKDLSYLSDHLGLGKGETNDSGK